jgi:phosphatidylinositol alpha-1,6-mannosyltransferase
MPRDRRARPRLLVVSPTYPPAVGGAETLIEAVVSRLDAFDVHIAALETSGFVEADAGAGRQIRRWANEPPYGRRALARLNAATVGEAHRLRPDVVLSNHIRLAPATALAVVGRAAGWVQYFHAKELGVWPRQSRLAARRADVSIAVSRYTRDLVLAAGAPDERVHVIPPGVLPPSHRDGGRGDGPPTLLTVSRLEDWYKGHDTILSALPRIRDRVPDVRWVIAGDGVHRAELETRVRDAGLSEAVTFLGRISDADRDAWLARADLFVLPSRIPPDRKGGEGFGIVYVEAAAHALPVIAAAEGGALDAVADGRSGVLVPPQDAEALARAASDLLLDGDRRAAMGAAALAHAATFNWDRIASEVQDLLVAASALEARP